jgi:hypothetical protein
MKYPYTATLVFAILFSSCSRQTQTIDSTESVPLITTNLTAADTSGQLMREDDFWKFIDRSRELSGGNYQVQIGVMEKILLELPPEDIVKFDNTFTALLAATYDYKLWGASYVINGGCSDDCFDYFREYLIAHGKNKFYKTYQDPESCVDWIKSESEDNWEGIRYAAMKAYKEKTGAEIPLTYHADYKIKGERFDENTVDKLYPRLAEKFLEL